MKIMALDYGEKRVGVASTDGSGSFALPRMVLPNDHELFKKIAQFKEEEGIELVVMGESRDFKGFPNPIHEEALKFKKLLEESGISVIFHPEVLTTVEARRLQGQTDMTDASAAALILKNYLESHPLPEN
jgi:putative holliday junction resolvase